MKTPQQHEELAVKLWFESRDENCFAKFIQACYHHEEALKLDPSLDFARRNCNWFVKPKSFLPKQSEKSFYANCKISVLVVGFSRPEGAMRAAISAQLMASRPELVEILVCTDESDPLKDRYKALPDLTTFVIDDRRTSAKWNHLYKQSTGEIIVMVCDDVVFTTPGWDEYLRRHWPEDGMAVLNTTGPMFLEFPIISRKMADTLGYIAYPELTHAGIDAFWSHVGHTLGIFYYVMSGCRIEHRHYETHIIHDRNKRYSVNQVFTPEEIMDCALTEAQKLK